MQPPVPPHPAKRRTIWETLRDSFFTGIVVGAPIGITIWLVWSFISFVDKNIAPMVPTAANPETYLKFAIPGFGIVVAVAGLTLLGLLTANIIGRSLLALGERGLRRVPLVNGIYTSLKQVFETFASNEASSFKEAVLVEYPSRGLWVLAFITSRSPGAELRVHVPDAIACFVPSTPNPAMGQLVYVSPERIRKLDMPVDHVLKLVITFGVLSVDQVSGDARVIGK
jgi:uncharacterized membrane protein